VEAQVLGKQVLRSGTSVGAHYREASRARSNAEFVSKLECGLQEIEETRYWLELLTESGMVRQEELQDLFREAEELTSIFVASARNRKTGYSMIWPSRLVMSLGDHAHHSLFTVHRFTMSSIRT
jgi:four helix bundle protein